MDFILEVLNVLGDTLTNLRRGLNRRVEMEMSIIRLCTSDTASLATGATPVVAKEIKPAPKVEAPAPVVEPEPIPEPEPEPIPEPTPEPQPEPEPIIEEAPVVEEPTPIIEEPEPVIEEPAPAPVVESVPEHISLTESLPDG
ncbi:MAG: hypothetical protein Q4F70_02315, partial [Clostridia bacterium]|nr:hypothetical protein [Clostridia bacterium]